MQKKKKKVNQTILNTLTNYTDGTMKMGVN